MKYKKLVIGILVGTGVTANAYANSGAVCGDPAEPILSVADYNGDGIVNGKDESLMATTMAKGGYYALYDRNADGMLDAQDVEMSAHDIGAVSTETDQRLAEMYHRFKHFQDISGFDEISAMGFEPLGSAFQYHGQHWATLAGQMAAYGLTLANPEAAEGINVLSDGSDIPAMYWGQGGIPLFEDPEAETGLSTLDWPAPDGVWNFKQVMAFGNSSPDFFPETEDDKWHAHAGLCVTMWDLGSGPEWILNQHTTNAECQAMPNLAKVEYNGQVFNLWANFWMMHAWLFDLNPNGVFGNVHPCVDPDAPSEQTINGGRFVPPFFQHHD